jgi:DNA-binding MarR family transcriptional regulator
VLITLFNAPDRRLGMSALATAALLSPSGLTHLVTRMERDGLVQREGDADDRRKFHAVLTPAGADRLAEARLTHNAVLRTVLLPHLDTRSRRLLAGVGARFGASEGSGLAPRDSSP